MSAQLRLERTWKLEAQENLKKTVTSVAVLLYHFIQFGIFELAKQVTKSVKNSNFARAARFFALWFKKPLKKKYFRLQGPWEIYELFLMSRSAWPIYENQSSNFAVTGHSQGELNDKRPEEEEPAIGGNLQVRVCGGRAEGSVARTPFGRLRALKCASSYRPALSAWLLGNGPAERTGSAREARNPTLLPHTDEESVWNMRLELQAGSERVAAGKRTSRENGKRARSAQPNSTTTQSAAHPELGCAPQARVPGSPHTELCEWKRGNVGTENERKEGMGTGRNVGWTRTRYDCGTRYDRQHNRNDV
ncbi:hypothetical protein C8F04DRAFT_1201300 [Mycena alexandri]|uniref:Uncharacterized protein n=1 Tax=Mycena alexandri TaxID=1745969 RepID=A0AAD6RWV9_9AGAR|nr:hypothetical protein C8F04DRAFT_1201300 [Mycena alexandri]